jgi:mono/diheme cytochrome c family protein
MFRRVNRAMASLALACVMVAGLALVGQGQSPGGSVDAKKLQNPVPADAKTIAEGERLFRRYCRMCHGADAKGNGPQAPKGTNPPDLTDSAWETGSADGEIFVVIRDGVGPKFDMKGFNSKLTVKEMWSLVNYVRSVGPKP